MYQVEDEPIETIHLYVVREGDKHPSLIPVIISVLALSFLIAIGVLSPYKQPEQRASIRVPAVLLPLKTFTTSVAIISTGSKQYPPTIAHGKLTITNGSIVSEELPKGMILTGKDGVEVATDSAVFVPAGSAAGYGVAYVSAHTTVSGKNGNIPAFDINNVEGSSIYIRNLQPFTGGKDAYAVTFATQRDHIRATQQARATLAQEIWDLHYPCKEKYSVGLSTLKMTWLCQFVIYSIPSYMHAVRVVLQGNDLLVDVVIVVHPKRIWVK
jgi:hypothetical protein